MLSKKYLIVIGGPTASGKTALAIQLAQHFSTEIISADSRQFYQEMNIGTAKPTTAELAAVKHHFVNNLSIHDDYSVGDFEAEATLTLEKIFAEKDVAIMVGGTGLYIRAVCEGLDDFPDTPLSTRQYFENLHQENGIEYLQKMLQDVDNQYFTKIDISNPARLIRALSVWKTSGQPYSNFLGKKKTERNFEPIYLVLDVPREILYNRINKRVDAMITAGLEQEAKELWEFKNRNALQTVGYSELFNYFEGQYSRVEAIEKIKQHTRNYAKRQITWFKKDAHWQRILPTDFDKVIQLICP